MNGYEQALIDKMKRDGAADLAIRTFQYHLCAVDRNQKVAIGEKDIEPVDSLPRMSELSIPDKDECRQLLRQAVVIKLNGGLGTSMGLTRAKSSMQVKDGQSFLDIIIGQILDLRNTYEVDVPLIFMNSFSTEADTRAITERYPSLPLSAFPLFIQQNRVPKIERESLMPVIHTIHPDYEWCPPGHGDIYTVLQTSGVLEKLIAAGKRYVFLSNADNLGATLELTVLHWMANQGKPFIMETTRRTLADRKGGHLALRRDGRFVLRESAQCPENETDLFQDINRYKYFNTNNLWMDIDAVRSTLESHKQIMPLPLIVNRKTVNPTDSTSTPVYQLETACGAAIECFDGAAALDVPRTRFVPVKTTNDLLALRSDRFEVRNHVVVESDTCRGQTITIDLDKQYYSQMADFEARFAKGIPSLMHCTSLTVNGDVYFGSRVVLKGDVTISGSDSPVIIPDAAVIGKE
ncbi:MAG: UTP--glucose-1-phosphate uridylyltransferase [Spartobacteria bacterium]|nr:UTP--glucose-1-phosphate uridylyltransferase [Spartobacteria bacterium]